MYSPSASPNYRQMAGDVYHSFFMFFFVFIEICQCCFSVETNQGWQDQCYVFFSLIVCVCEYCEVFSVLRFSEFCVPQCCVFLSAMLWLATNQVWQPRPDGLPANWSLPLPVSQPPAMSPPLLSILPSTLLCCLCNCCSSVTALTPFASQRGAVFQCLLPPRSQLLCGEPTQRGSPARPASCPAGSW